MEKKRVKTRSAERCTRAEKKEKKKEKIRPERPSGPGTAVYSLVILHSQGRMLPDIR